MQTTIRKAQVTAAGHKILDWQAFVEPWAKEAITKALQSPVDPASGTERALVLPPFAVKHVKGAISHVNKVASAREREVNTFTKPSGKFS